MSHYTLLKKENKELQTFYQKYCITPPPHADWAAQYQGTRITAYQSGKILFQGKNAEQEYYRWQKEEKEEKEPSSSSLSQLSLIGSDEVGNGSYFGPLVVVAAYVTKEDIPWLTTLEVADSKTLTDEKMKKIAPQLKEKLPYQALIVSPKKYNAIQPRYNAVKMKVALHNQTLLLLEKRIEKENQPLDALLIDQFTSEKNYQQYVKEEKEQPHHPVLMRVKGEQEHLAVAAASIIARTLFLEQLEQLGVPYHLTLPSGAGEKVDQVGVELCRRYGVDTLEKVAKLHFKNTQKIKAKL